MRSSPAQMLGRTSSNATVGIDEPVVVLGVTFPIADLAVGDIARKAVAFLDLAYELVALSRDNVEVVIGQLAPLLFQPAFHLLPIAFNTFPVHVYLLWWISGSLFVTTTSEPSCVNRCANAAKTTTSGVWIGLRRKIKCSAIDRSWHPHCLPFERHRHPVDAHRRRHTMNDQNQSQRPNQQPGHEQKQDQQRNPRQGRDLPGQTQ